MNETIIELINKYKDGLTRDLYGTSVYIEPEVGFSVAIYDRYKSMIIEAKDLYISTFEKVENIMGFFEKCEDMLLNVAVELCKVLSRDFIELGEIEYSSKRILEICTNRYDGFDAYIEVCAELQNKAIQICEAYGEEVQYREFRKESRGRWSSATFGGNAMRAWNNQLDAEMMNIAEGIGHSIINSVGNSLSKAKMERQLKVLFEDENVKEQIIDSVIVSLANLVLVLHGYICDIMDWSVYPIGKEEKERAKAILDNMTDSNLNIDQAKPFIEKLFQLNPLEESIYVACVAQYGDQEGTLQEIGEYLHIDIVGIKNQVVENLLDLISDDVDPKQTEFKEIEEKFEIHLEKIGLKEKDDKVARQKFKEYEKEFDRMKRTVDGLEFSTYEEAIKAEEEKKQLEQLVADSGEPTNVLDLCYEEKVKKLIEEIERGFETEIKNKYIEIVQGKIQQFDVNYRTVEGVLYDTRQQALAKRIYILIMDITKDNKTYENVCHAKQILQEKIKEYHITEEDAREVAEYLAILDFQCRTFNGIVYDSYEMYLQAVKEDADMGKILAGVLAPTKDSTLSYEKKIIDLRAKIDATYETRAKEKYLQMCDRYLEDFNVKFCTLSLFKRVSREEAVQERAVMFLKNQGKVQSLEELDELRKRLIDFLPELGITFEEAVKAKEWIEKQEIAINKKKNKKGLFW